MKVRANGRKDNFVYACHRLQGKPCSSHRSLPAQQSCALWKTNNYDCHLSRKSLCIQMLLLFHNFSLVFYYIYAAYYKILLYQNILESNFFISRIAEKITANIMLHFLPSIDNFSQALKDILKCGQCYNSQGKLPFKMNFLALFQKEYEKFLKPDYQFNAQHTPATIIKQLRNHSTAKQCLKSLTKKTSNGFKIMRRLSFLHMLIMYSNEFYGLVDVAVEEPMQSSHPWLNQTAILPYFYFLKKCVSSQELYMKVKEVSGEPTFEKLFYIHQLFLQLFKIVQKMPLIGRYYKDKNQVLTSTFIEVIAVQAQKIYSSFKYCIQELVSNHTMYIKSKEDEVLFKSILEESLPLVNQEMKKLFLDKYFYPYGKGICIRLFRTEQQSQPCMKVINGILSDHKDTERRHAQDDLEKTLFPEDGKIDLEFYQQSLRHQLPKHEEINFEQVEQIEEMNEELPEFDDTTKIDKKQTSDHMEKCEQV